VLGHNGTIGWGFTTTNLDSQDVFVERVDPTDPNRYITPDGARSFGVREETINVAWGDPVTMRVRETRHGPVIDDFIRRTEGITPQGHVLALQATALDGADTSAEGFGRLGMAQNWEDFLNAARRIGSPMQNMVYADTSGNIGLISPAKVPIRRKGDGSMPVPGWTGEYDWAGFVPFDQLPSRLQSAGRPHRQRQRAPRPGRLPPFHQQGLGRALSPASRRPAPARGRAPSGLRHDRDAGRQSLARRQRHPAVPAEGQRRAMPALRGHTSFWAAGTASCWRAAPSR
jgi:hypothetical protein